MPISLPFFILAFFSEENLPKKMEDVPVIKSKEQAEDGKLILVCMKWHNWACFLPGIACFFRVRTVT